jgi:hypothetical protein
MAANIHDKNVLAKLSKNPDSDVRMWVAYNPMTPELILGKLAEDRYLALPEVPDRVLSGLTGTALVEELTLHCKPI